MGSRLCCLVLVVCGLLPAAQVFAQSEDAFQKFLKQRRSEYQQFRSERDQQFHSFLKRQWKAFKSYAGEVEDPAPKPSAIPRAEEPEPRKAPEPVAVEPKAPPAREKPEPEPVRKAPPRPAPEEEPEPEALQPEARQVSVRVFGRKLTAPVPDAWSELHLGQVSSRGVATFWKDFAQGPSAGPTVKALGKASDRWNLGDWGYVRLVYALADEAADGSAEARLLTWALLLKSGYAVRTGIAHGEVVLLFRSRDHLFEVPYFRIDGHRYYVFDPDGDPASSGLRSYDGEFPGKVRPVAVAAQEPPSVGPGREGRDLKFKFHGKAYEVRVSVNPNLLAFQGSLPQLALKDYFEMRPPKGFSEDLHRQLQKEMAGMPPREAVDFLLAFVQKAFAYKRDQDQFGGENYLFPTETVHYPYSDCEDRAVLFSWLVHDLLGYPVVGLDYPGHVATAVALPKGGRGQYVKRDGHRYFVADPTYVNAGVGMVMPRYRDTQPKVLPAW
ncbi:MAG TPA: hypothetical protein VKA48_06580 [Gammaproteobacteria bacterium]|nr:hypothetical protein [Gammaproteobacteria bacterium]